MCRPPNTVHQHPGQECPKCEWVFAQSSLTDTWTTPSIYTACARPILSFPRSYTEKYSLRKTAPRIQFSVDVLTVFSLKVVKQWPLESWGSQRHTPFSMSPYRRVPPISKPSTILCFISHFWYVSRDFLSSRGYESSSKTKKGQDMRLPWGRLWGRGGLGVGETEEWKTTKSYCRA